MVKQNQSKRKLSSTIGWKALFYSAKRKGDFQGRSRISYTKPIPVYFPLIVFGQ